MKIETRVKVAIAVVFSLGFFLGGLGGLVCWLSFPRSEAQRLQVLIDELVVNQELLVHFRKHQPPGRKPKVQAIVTDLSNISGMFEGDNSEEALRNANYVYQSDKEHSLSSRMSSRRPVGELVRAVGKVGTSGGRAFVKIEEVQIDGQINVDLQLLGPIHEGQTAEVIISQIPVSKTKE